jgi:hypothetical protein
MPAGTHEKAKYYLKEELSFLYEHGGVLIQTLRYPTYRKKALLGVCNGKARKEVLKVRLDGSLSVTQCGRDRSPIREVSIQRSVTWP